MPVAPASVPHPLAVHTRMNEFGMPMQPLTAPGLPLGNPYHPYNRLSQTMKEKEMLRNNMLTQQETITQLEEEVDTLRREGTRFDDILRKNYQDIDTLR